MKRMATAILLGIATCLFPTQHASAGDEGWAAFGGFVGGALLTHVAHEGHNRRSHYSQPVRYARPVSSCAPTHYAPPPPPPPRPSGHYETRTVRHWVPGAWITERLPCGQIRQVWQEGYYQTRTKQVWVEHGHHRGHRSAW